MEHLPVILGDYIDKSAAVPICNVGVDGGFGKDAEGERKSNAPR